MEEFAQRVKKVKQQDEGNNSNTCGSSATKLWYYKELEELLTHRTKNHSYRIPNRHLPTAKIDGFIQFSDKGIDDGNAAFGSLDATNGLTSVSLDRRLDNDGDPLAITASEAVAASEIPSWNWRETPGTAGEGPPPLFGGRVNTVKLGEYQRRIGIDGTGAAIKEAIKAAFGLRTKRAFWLVDEANVIRSIDRDMPLCSYTLHVDEGISIKVCFYDESDQMDVRTEEKTLYTEVDFHDFLSRRGLIGLREINDYRWSSSWCSVPGSKTFR